MKCFPLFLAVLLVIPATALAQQKDRPGGREGQSNRQRPQEDVSSVVQRVMQLDQNQDGLLSADEVTDQRLQGMMTEADTDGDKTLTQAELTSFFQQRLRQRGNRDGAGGPGAGEGRRGGARGDGPGAGPGGPGMGRRGGRMGMPRPGQVLPDFVVQQLQLDDGQKAELEKLQEMVDARLRSILTEEQWEQLQSPPPGGPQAGGRAGGQSGGPEGAGGRRGGRGGRGRNRGGDNS